MGEKKEKIVISGYLYGIILFLIVFGLVAFAIYLIYILIVKASTNQFADTTILQAMFTLLISVIVGSLLTKNLESRNAKRLEVFKVRKDISLRIIELSGIIMSSNDIDKQKAMLLLNNENMKVKLFFDDNTVRAVKRFLEEQSISTYGEMTDILKKHLK